MKLQEDDNLLSRKQLSKDSTRHLEVVADLPTTMGTSCGAIADGVFHGRISPRCASPVRMDPFHGVDSDSVIFSRTPGLPSPPSLAPERSTRILPSVTAAPVVPTRSLAARPGSSRRLSGMRDSGTSPDSDVPSVPDYLFLFWDWLDSQRFAIIQGASSFCGRFEPSDVN